MLTWVALLLVPAGCALALGWAARGARPIHAGLAVPLLALAWAAPDTRVGEISTIVLIAGSAVTLGRLLAGAAPLPLLKAGVIAMAVVDAWLVFSGRLQTPNAVLVAASPGLGLPQLQSAAFGTAGLGYGDFFAAAVLGGIVAAERGPQLAAAVGMVVVSLCWDQLFLVYDVLPATIPPAVVLAALQRTPSHSGKEHLMSVPTLERPTSPPPPQPPPAVSNGRRNPPRLALALGATALLATIALTIALLATGAFDGNRPATAVTRPPRPAPGSTPPRSTPTPLRASSTSPRTQPPRPPPGRSACPARRRPPTPAPAQCSTPRAGSSPPTTSSPAPRRSP